MHGLKREAHLDGLPRALFFFDVIATWVFGVVAFAVAAFYVLPVLVCLEAIIFDRQ